MGYGLWVMGIKKARKLKIISPLTLVIGELIKEY